MVIAAYEALVKLVGMKLVLASESERRKELLSWLGLPFEVRKSGFDESEIAAEDAEVLAGALALAKAETVAAKIAAEKMLPTTLEKEGVPLRVDPCYVVGADTTVQFQAEVMGKPRDLDDAREMLKKLRGRSHDVYTGVAIVEVFSRKKINFVDKSGVLFRDFSDEELENYIASSESLGKAGSYMLFGKARGLIENVSGSATNVVGLPLIRLAQALNGLGMEIKVDVEKTIVDKTGFAS